MTQKPNPKENETEVATDTNLVQTEHVLEPTAI